MKINNFFKKSLSLLLMAIMIIHNIQNIYAASYSVSVSQKSIKAGSNVTIKINGNGCEGSFSVSANNGATITGQNPIWTGESTTVKAGSKNFSITVTPVSVTNSSDASKITDQLSSKTIDISIKTTTTNNNTGTNNSNTNNNNNDTNNNNNNTSTINKSSDNALKSLTVSNGTLSPSFKASKTRYDISLAGNVTEVTINAKANHSKATVSGTGKKSLKAGDNTFNVVCKAENGSTKTYTLNFHVDETPLVYTKFNDKDLGVVRTLDNIKSPTNFKQGSITLEDQEITGFINEKTGMKLAYLIDEKGNKDFYIVKDGVVVSVFKKISINGKEYVLVTAENELEEVKNLTPSKIKINDIELDGWNFSDKIHSNYCVVYLMNSEGKEALYCYETTEGTLQLYSPFEIASEEKSSELDLNIFVITTGLFAFTTIISIVYIIYYKKKKIAEIREYYERRTQKQGE